MDDVTSRPCEAIERGTVSLTTEPKSPTRGGGAEDPQFAAGGFKILGRLAAFLVDLYGLLWCVTPQNCLGDRDFWARDGVIRAAEAGIKTCWRSRPVQELKM